MPTSLAFLVLLVLPLASAGPLGTLDSAAPVELFGAAFAGSDDLSLFHKAFDQATLSGTLHSGNIVDRERRYSPCPGDPPTPTEQTRTLASTSSSTPTPIYFEVDARSLAIVEFGQEERTPAGTGDPTASDTPDAVPAAYLGPNPFLIRATSSAPGSSADAPGAVRAFPIGAFLVAPSGTIEFPLSGTVVIPVGNLTIFQGDKTSTFNSDPTTEKRSCPPLPALPPDSFTTNVYHTLRIQADSAVLNVQQSGLDRTLKFYRGEDAAEPTPTGNDYNRMCPSSDDGYWHRNSAGSLQQSYANCALPATSFTAIGLRAQVDGVAAFENANGTLVTGAESEDIADEPAHLVGNLELVPASVEESGRRMRTDLGGTVFSVNFPPAPIDAQRDWVAYASGAGGGALLLGVVLYSWPILKWRSALLLAPLYARLKKDDVLENPLRDDILALVQETPGISASELGRRVECGWGTLVYHLTVLERMQLVSSAREGRHKRFFAQGRINYSDKGAVGLLANPAARTILDAIRASPGAIQKDLSHRLNLSPGTVAWHVERLAAEGLVIKEDEGRTVRYYPSERLLQLTRSLAA